jgi:hypothetical protein
LDPQLAAPARCSPIAKIGEVAVYSLVTPFLFLATLYSSALLKILDVHWTRGGVWKMLENLIVSFSPTRE